jgi:hypothetical protein
MKYEKMIIPINQTPADIAFFRRQGWQIQSMGGGYITIVRKECVCAYWIAAKYLDSRGVTHNHGCPVYKPTQTQSQP